MLCIADKRTSAKKNWWLVFPDFDHLKLDYLLFSFIFHPKEKFNRIFKLLIKENGLRMLI
jgi:hypothetical protein